MDVVFFVMLIFIEIIDGDENEVVFNSENGFVIVNLFVEDVIFILLDFMVNVGVFVCLLVIVMDFDLLSLQFSINYDMVMLEYIGS